LSNGEGIAYWRPQVMRHSHPDGRVEYAVHDVYFARGGSVVTYTEHARSARKATVEELEAWLRSMLPEAKEGVVCGDLGYTHDADDLALWLDYIGDTPIDYAAEDEASASGSG
jgi:exonuclease III